MKILLASLVVILLTLIWVYFIRTRNYFLVRGIAHQKPVLFFGNTFDLATRRKGIYDFLEGLFDSFNKNEKIFGFFGVFNRPILVVVNPALIYKILAKDFNYFVNHDHNENIRIDRLLDKSVLFLRGQEWKDMRSILNPIFSSAMMKYMFGLVMDVNVNFWKRIEAKAKKNGGKIEVDTLETFSRITANTIVTTTLGFHYDYEEDREEDVKRLTEKIFHDISNPTKLALVTIFPELFKIFGLNILHTSVHEFFLDRVVKEVQLRASGEIVRPDLIQLLVQARQKENLGQKKKLKLTDEDLVAQALVFFVAGLDTTTALLQALSFELSCNPEVQEKLLNEVDDMLEQLEGKKISYEQLNSLKYLDMVISEGLRKWPPTRLMNRVCNADYELVDDESGKVYQLKKGDDLLILHGVLQNDESIFPSTETFDPERFNEENKETFPNRAYSPFGQGPRHCIGKRFALMGAKILLFELLSIMSFEKCDRTPDHLNLTKGFVGFDETFHVTLKMRNTSSI